MSSPARYLFVRPATDPYFFDDISITELMTYNSGCFSNSLAATADCASAIHRACFARGYDAGTAQETAGGVIGVGCFKAPFYGNFPIAPLR